MTEVTDPIPRNLVGLYDELKKDLDEKIPRKILNHNLLIATWNIRAFGGLTELWDYNPNKTPKRNFFALRCIAEIVSRFDIVAIQEVKGKLKALRHMLKVLGPDWGVILTDVTDGDAGNGERLAFIFDKRKVHLSGLACELVVPEEVLKKEKSRDKPRITLGVMKKQFVRTPYAVSFQSGKSTFILVTVHIFYGKKEEPEKRIPELKAIAEWMSSWARDVNAYHQDFIILGDFNIDEEKDELSETFRSEGLWVDPKLTELSKSIFDITKNYDQIAWFKESDEKTDALTMKPVKGDRFDFVKHLLKDPIKTKAQLSWFISDHYPLWYEFDLQSLIVREPTDADKKRKKWVTLIKSDIDDAVTEFVSILDAEELSIADEAEIYLKVLFTEDECKKYLEEIYETKGEDMSKQKLIELLGELGKKVVTELKTKKKAKAELKILKKILKSWSLLDNLKALFED